MTGLIGEDLAEGHRSGFVSLVGRPNVGKSTLLNRILGQKVSIVSDKPQTTRNQVRGVLTRPDSQVVFVDTPGIRSFGLAHVDPGQLIEAFPDLAALTVDCPRGCTHGAAEPECALDVAASGRQVDPARVTSYRRLLSSRETTTY